MEGNRKVERLQEHFNLDVLISIGYKVTTKRGIQFRKWATECINDYLVNGYTVYQKRLREEKEAHLLYIVVKNHSLSDVNKRIGVFLFILY